MVRPSSLLTIPLEVEMEVGAVKGKKKEKESKERKSKTIRDSSTSSFKSGGFPPVRLSSTLRGHIDADAVPGGGAYRNSLAEGVPFVSKPDVLKTRSFTLRICKRMPHLCQTLIP